MIDATRALIDDWTLLCDSLGGQAMTRDAGGVALLATGVPFPTLNLALAYGRDATSEAVSGLLDALQAAGLPHCLQLRPGAAPELIRLAGDRGLESQEEIPLMVATTTELASVAAPPILIRELAAEEVETHVALAASGFDAPRNSFEAWLPLRFSRPPGCGPTRAGWTAGR